MAKEYVRLTFTHLPEGATRRRAVWAIVVKRGPKFTTYKEVNREGEETFETGEVDADGIKIEQVRLILATPCDVTERPAQMNLRYAELEEVRPQRTRSKRS